MGSMLSKSCHPEGVPPRACKGQNDSREACVPPEVAVHRENRFYVISPKVHPAALYIGMTNNLHQHTWQHKTHTFEGFTDDCNAVSLLYWQSIDDADKAIDS
jgi:predicted GIY-YIG superfamily endonuclease